MATYYWVDGNGTWDNASTTNWSTISGGAGGSGPPTNADTVNFDANSGTSAVVTVASTAVALNTTINKSDIDLSLSGDVTMAPANGTVTFTAGTITLNNNVLTCGIFSSNNSNTRVIAFGTGNITVTGNNGIVWSTQTATGFSYTGTPLVKATYSGSTGTRVFRHGVSGGATESNSPSFAITAGTDTVLFTTPNYVKDLDFTGFSGSWTNSNIQIYGNLTVSSTMTVSAGVAGLVFWATSGTQKITTAGKTLDFVVILGNGGSSINTTYQLQDNLTLGSTRTITLSGGTLDLTGNSGNWTLSVGLFNASNVVTRSIKFGTGNITLTGSGTVWTTSTVTGFTYTGTPTVNVSNNSATATTVITGTLSEAQALNFNYTVGTYTLTDTAAVYKSLSFSGFTGTVPNSARTIYGNLTIAAGATNSAGANATTFAATSGTQQITTNGVTLDYPLTFNGIGGTFAFQDALTQGSTRAFTITNGTVQLKAGATATVGALATSGTNQKILQSTSAGSQATLSQASGNFNAQYLTVKDIAATGGAKFNGLNNCITQGNNSGWYFAPQLGRPLPAFAF